MAFTVTGITTISDVRDGASGMGITRFFSTAATGGSISTTQGSRTFFRDVSHTAGTTATTPSSTDVFALLIGSNGSNGDRGVGRWNIPVTTLPTTAALAETAWNTAWTNRPGDDLAGDQAWFYTGTETNPTGQTVWISTGTSWNLQSEVIDGNLLVAGTITTAKLNIDETLTLSGPESGFIAGRTGTSDFGTDGFYIGRTTTTGTTADGFQLSHTSVVGANHPELTENTVTGVVHDDFTGLQVYEPVFYRRNPELDDIGALLDVQNETVRLAANESHTLTVYGGGGGGGGASNSLGGDGTDGTAGGTTTITMTSVPTGYTGATTFTGTGGAGGAAGTGFSGRGGTDPAGNGTAGGTTEFGAGGAGGIGAFAPGEVILTGGAGGDADSNHYGAGGGGGGSGYHQARGQMGELGQGGTAAASNEYTIDLTGLGAATLTATTIGSLGVGGAGGAGSGDAGGGGAGGDGAQGVAYLEGVLGGYIAHSLRSILDRLDALDGGV